MTCRLVATVMADEPERAAETLRDPPDGVDYVELRLDALADASAAKVRALLELPRSAPVIASCHGTPDDEEKRFALLAAAGEAGAEILDVDDTALERFPASVPGERMASCHLSRFMPRLEALAGRVAGHGTRFSKLVVPAGTPLHLAELLDLQEHGPEGLAITSVGRLSEAGRVMAVSRGTPLVYGAADPARPGHPDQPSVARLHEMFHVGVIAPTTRYYGVVGRPVAHSLSPAYHNAIFRGTGVDARLVALDVDDLRDVMVLADALRLDGLCVTHPFKHSALDLVASVQPGAAAAGSANTLLRTPAGWQARNTDWKAACDLLPKLLRKWGREHPGETPRVLLLGSGGAACAVALGLVEEDVELAIWSRRLSNARDLAEALAGSLPAVAIPDPGHFPADMVINATPVGMPGADPGELVLEAGNFRPGALLVDLAYGDEDSPVRRAAAEAGAQMTTGEDFFHLQARRQAELFTQGPVPKDLLRTAQAAAS